MSYWKNNTFFFLLFASFSSVSLANTDHQDIAENLEALVKSEHAEQGLVSLGAIISKGNETIATAVVGEREINSKVKVSADDKWHLGSVTKSITATMIARLVEQDVLQWETTIGEVFTNDAINSDWRPVTIAMLLNHVSGADADFPWRIQSLQPKEGPTRQSLRKEEVLKILADKPDYKPGSDFEYSNVGYTIVGIMASIKTGKSWETLVREEVFQPLQLASAGFGPPTDQTGQLEQPRGHKDTWFSGPESVSTDTDNSPIMGPAGSVHMSLKDLTTYANEHLLGSQGQSTYLKQETFQYLHKMGPNDYANGWIAAQKTAWANDQEVLYHSGTNRFWYALLVMVPDSQLSIAVTTNDGNLNAARESAWKIVREVGTLAISASN